jgi:hypothetical protein
MFHCASSAMPTMTTATPTPTPKMASSWRDLLPSNAHFSQKPDGVAKVPSAHAPHSAEPAA